MSQSICGNCARPPYMRQPLNRIGNDVLVCTDCFCFISGSDPRDPAIEMTARSGGGYYLTAEEWRAAGEPRIPVPAPGPPEPPQPPRHRAYSATRVRGWLPYIAGYAAVRLIERWRGKRMKHEPGDPR